MTVEFTSVARGNPQDPSAPKKYYPVARSTGELTLPGLAERAAEISTLSSVDVAAAVEAFLAIIPQALAAGHIVRLGDFGTFSLRLRSVGVDAQEAVTAQQITKAVVSFRPGSRFKEKLDAIEFKKA